MVMRASAIKVGVVGAGYWGPNIIRNLAGRGVLDSVCDTDAAALAKVHAAHPNVATTADFGALLARPIDAVVIAAPAQLHAPMAMRAIASGKHVLVEKPLALSVSDGKQIAAASRAANVTVFVGHLLLYHAAVKKLRALIAEGVIGDVWHVRSRRLSLGKLRTHEDVWWSFAPHDVALILAIMGEEPSGVLASRTMGRNVELSDLVYADYEFSHGRSAHVEVCWLDPEKSARLDVFGTRGVLTLTDARQGSTLVVKPIELGKDARGAPVVTRGEEQRVKVDEEEPLAAELSAFIKSVETGVSAETDAEQGVAVLRMLSMADDAAIRRLELRAFA